MMSKGSGDSIRDRTREVLLDCKTISGRLLTRDAGVAVREGNASMTSISSSDMAGMAATLSSASRCFLGDGSTGDEDSWYRESRVYVTGELCW
jgi:hypothetical protein